MPPTRTNHKHKNTEASSSKQGEKKKSSKYQPKANALPGKQKIKGALRQARRLLAKDGLAANVKVDTERRIKALEAELEQTEVSQKERDLAVRYHKIKFFERQKVTRKLNQTKKAKESAGESEGKKLEEDLLRYRVDLNYILHYPKTKKYISLFPPEVRQGDPETPSPAPEPDKTSKEREEIRSWVKECMKKGELPAEPELQRDSDISSHQTTKVPKSAQKFSSTVKKAASKDDHKDTKRPADIGEDDFFGNDDESSEDED